MNLAPFLRGRPPARRNPAGRLPDWPYPVPCDPGASPRGLADEGDLPEPLRAAVARAVAAVRAESDPLVARLADEGVEDGWAGAFNDLWLADVDARHAAVAARAGMEVLGSGSRRCALAVAPGLVVKVAMHDDGRQGTGEEVFLWTYAAPDHAAWLMPTLAAADDGLWSIMPRSEGAGLAHELPDGLSVMDYDGDYNWGVFCGRPVLLDYE